MQFAFSQACHPLVSIRVRQQYIGPSGEEAALSMISVVLPTHNRAHFLPGAIQSVLRQSYQNFELIVVDDASTDETPDVMRTFSDERLRYIRLPTNRGPSGARNAGIREARADLIAFLDDDDEYYPQMLERAWALMNSHPSIGFSWCGVRKVQYRGGVEIAAADGIFVVPVFDDRREAYLRFLRGPRPGSGYGFVVRLKCLQEIGMFDEELRSSVDADLFIRLARRYDYRVIPEILVKVREHRGLRVSRDAIARITALERIMEKHR